MYLSVLNINGVRVVVGEWLYEIIKMSVGSLITSKKWKKEKCVVSPCTIKGEAITARHWCCDMPQDHRLIVMYSFIMGSVDTGAECLDGNIGDIVSFSFLEWRFKLKVCVCWGGGACRVWVWYADYWHNKNLYNILYRNCSTSCTHDIQKVCMYVFL